MPSPNIEDLWAKQWAKQQAQERKDRIHHLLSHLANTEERICCLIDEDEQDEAKEEVEALVAGVRNVLEGLLV